MRRRGSRSGRVRACSRRGSQGDGSGWTARDDGSVVELLGNLCENAMAGTYEQITYELGCVVLPPLPPPDPYE
jgi:hypothetical protein